MSNRLPCRGSATCRLYSILSLFKMLQYCMFFLGHIINVLSKVLIKQANARKLQEHVNLSFECLIYVCVCVCVFERLSIFMYVFRRYVSNMMDLYCGQFLQLFISHAFFVWYLCFLAECLLYLIVGNMLSMN